MSLPNNTQEEAPTRGGETTPDDRAYPGLYSLKSRLSILGCETVISLGSLIAISPHANEDGLRWADVITVRPRPDDGGALWFSAFGGRWIAEIDKIADAAMAIGSSLKVGTEA